MLRAHSPTRVNLQWFYALYAKKIVIRIQHLHSFAGWSLVNSEAFHVVNFKEQVHLEQDRTIDDCTRLGLSDSNALHLHNRPSGQLRPA